MTSVTRFDPLRSATGIARYPHGLSDRGYERGQRKYQPSNDKVFVFGSLAVGRPLTGKEHEAIVSIAHVLDIRQTGGEGIRDQYRFGEHFGCRQHDIAPHFLRPCGVVERECGNVATGYSALSPSADYRPYGKVNCCPEPASMPRSPEHLSEVGDESAGNGLGHGGADYDAPLGLAVLDGFEIDKAAKADEVVPDFDSQSFDKVTGDDYRLGPVRLFDLGCHRVEPLGQCSISHQ